MLHGSLYNSLDPVNPQCMVFAKSGGSSKLLGDATGMLVALRFPRPPWLIPPSHFLYFPFINLVGDINCRNLTYISCLHGKLSFHIKCTQSLASASDELENLFPHFSFFSLRPFIIFLLTKQKSLTIHTNLRRFCQIISEYLARLREFKDFQHWTEIQKLMENLVQPPC